MTRTTAPGEYYGVDPHADNLAAQIESAVSAHLPDSGLVHHIYALIDGAFDDTWGPQLLKASRAPGADVCSVYAGTPLEGAEECAPFLGAIGRTDLPGLLARADSRPMLSFIQTPLGLDALQRHLSGFIRAQTADGMTLVLRMADAICFRDIVAAMGQRFTSALRAGFAAWHVIGRDGNAYSWAGTATEATPGSLPAPRTEPWPMSDAAYAHIVDSAEADGVLCNVVRGNAELAELHSAAELHRRVLVMLAALDAAGVEDAPRRSRLTARALEQADELAALMWLKEQVRRAE